MRIVPRIYHSISIHPQANARWSYTDPPLATTPADLRDIYMPDPGWPWLEWDWDQIELRILAALAADKPLLTTFRNGWDVHSLNTCDIFSLPVPPNRVDPHDDPACAVWRETVRWQGKDDPRRVFAKRFVYRLNYGGNPQTMGDMPGAKALGLDGRKLTRLANAFLTAHPELAYWRRQIEDQVRRTGEIRTFMGRRRKFLQKGKKRIRDAFDAPMQMGVQDIANVTFLEIWDRWAPDVIYKYGMHDSMKWGITATRLPEIRPLIEQIVQQPRQVGSVLMEFPAKFKIREA